MFDILFGWRKASKCKNSIKRVQCRLKLLKNKRSCIIRQLRDDLSELLRNGHYQIVIDRVEQLLVDEKIVSVYDLLDNFCEFIIINLPYIRRHKDCPNDINEAVSSLIYASARLGDLPELVLIRKLFAERYGQRFERCALQLLPGNLVSHQIKDNLCISSVSDEEKYRLVDEIAKSCFQKGPLLLEYRCESQEQQVNETSNAAADYNKRSKDSEAKIVGVCVDYSPESMKLLPTDTCADSAHCLKNNSNKRVLDSAQPLYLAKSPISSPECVLGRDISGFTYERIIERRALESSAEDSAELPQQQMIYLDDIQEFESTVSKDVSLQDQRLFMFKAPWVPLRLKKTNCSNFEGTKKKLESQPRSLRKNNKTFRKRMRRRSLSMENSFVADTDSVMYYHESAPDSKQKHQNRRRNSRKSYDTFAHDQPCYVKFRTTLTFVKCIDDNSRSTSYSGPYCSLEHPCYYWIADETDNRESPFRVPRRISEAEKDNSKHSLKQIGITRQDVESKWDHFVKPDIEEVWESQETCSSIMSSTSRRKDQSAGKEKMAPYLRAVTMPPERPADRLTDNILRSNSFPVQEPGNGLSEKRHIHPKLPDYDEIAAKFIALKKEKLHNKC